MSLHARTGGRDPRRGGEFADELPAAADPNPSDVVEAMVDLTFKMIQAGRETRSSLIAGGRPACS